MICTAVSYNHQSLKNTV